MTSLHALCERLREHFPNLYIQANPDDSSVDWSIHIPKQDGLKFDCDLSAQADELHLVVASFWLEWFPLDNPEVFDRYWDAVRGLLTGEYRILESVRFGRGIGGCLQRQKENTWKTIGNSSSSLLPGRWFTASRVIRNV